MHVILDNIAATMVAFIVALILVAVLHKGRVTAVDNTVYYGARVQVQSLVDMLDRDLVNVGSGVPEGSPKIVTYTPTEFSFRRRMDIGEPVETITYKTIVADTIPSPVNDIILYRIERLSDGVLTGSSMATLRHFSVNLLDDYHQPVPESNLDATRVIKVDFTASFPLGRGDFLNETRWAGSYSPQNLDRYRN